MELSLDVRHRADVVEFVSNSRDEYDRLLDEAPDIPSDSIHAFNKEFPDKDNKPDVCNGLNIIPDDNSVVSRKHESVKKWIHSVAAVLKNRKSLDGSNMELVNVHSL